MSFISPNSQILLKSAEWAWATWRTRQPLPRPEPVPFDRADALRRLKKIRRIKSGRWDWSQVEVPMMRSTEEAIFWYQAFTTALKFARVKEFLLTCQTSIISSPPTSEDFTNWLQQTADRRQIDQQILKPLSYLFTPSQLLDWAVERDEWGRGWLRHWFLQGLQYFVLPYLTDAEMSRMQATIREHWHQWDLGRHLDLLILFGLHSEMQQIVENLQPTKNQQYWWPSVAIFGLESAEQVLHYGQKFKLRFNRRSQVQAWLANTEMSGLEIIYQSIAAIDNNKERAAAQEMFEAFIQTVQSPIIAPYVFALMEKSRVRSLAENWLTTNIPLAIEGLLPSANDNAKILTWLKVMARQDHRSETANAMTQNDPSENRWRLEQQALDYFSSVATNKREHKSLLKLQNSRLESQMLDGTIISRKSFQACLESAVFAPMFQQLLWTGYLPDDQKINLRVTEDFTLADMQDNLLEQPEKFVCFSLPHPLSLPKPELLAWSNLFADYKIIQPFEQLNRRTYLATAGSSIYTDFRDRSVFSLKLNISLKKAGWQGHTERRGNWQDFTKTDTESSITAVVRTARPPREYNNRSVDRIFFIAGQPTNLDVSNSAGAVDFVTVPRLFFSEVLRSIDLILKPKNSG